ncbi:MAG: 2-oxoacid:acceptor oxidoreductase family protein [Mogibacterium sp.]|nr:2-oxoacid:acceptor oxidoreductase family protein [Mogibacterium sp.]
MNDKVLFAGFGGQGILAVGKVLAEAAVENDLQVSWLPSYGPEMRGGTCNCMVVLGKDPVLSPFFIRPTVGIILNEASMKRYLDAMTGSRIAVINTSLVEVTPEIREKLKDVQIIEVPATDIAIELGTVKCANIVALGAYIKHSHDLTLDQIKKSVEKKFAKKPAMVTLNLKALEMGYERA